MSEWQAYEKVNGPLGGARLDALFAQLMALTANVNRGSKQTAFKAEQFMPQWDPDAPPERKPEMSPDDMLKAVKTMHRSMTRGAGKRGDSR